MDDKVQVCTRTCWALVIIGVQDQCEEQTFVSTSGSLAPLIAYLLVSTET